MPTNASDVKKYLDFALVQLAAESYLHGVDLTLLAANDPAEQRKAIRRLKYGFNDPTHDFIKQRAGVPEADADTIAESATTGSNSPVLPAYNRMVQSQAERFVADYEILDHHANDATGLAVTLFGKKDENGNIVEYILSPRSTEYRPWEFAGD